MCRLVKHVVVEAGGQAVSIPSSSSSSPLRPKTLARQMARIKTAFTADPRFQLTDDDLGAGPSKSRPKAGTLQTHVGEDDQRSVRGGEDDRSAAGDEDDAEDEDVAPDGMDPDGFAGPEPIVKPLTQEALKAFQAAQDRAGVVYISRIPPGMRPTKVRHLMSMHGEVGRVFLQQEGASFLCLLVDGGSDRRMLDAKRAYLRKKYTATKKAHFTEGWVEFKDKRVARAVAEMLNAQPIGGKKGTRWRDDVWTMKYLPKFKWHMLTEQIGG